MMTKKKESETVSPFEDIETIKAVAWKVKSEGFVTVAALRAEFGATRSTRAIAILFRDLRMFREVRRATDDGEQLGYEWADRRFSRSEIKKLHPALGEMVNELAATSTLKYDDFEEMRVRCRYTSPILGSVPIKDKQGDPTNCFERDHSGDYALILRYHQRAMATRALPMIGKEAAAAQRIGFSMIKIPANGNVKIVEHGIVEIGRSGGKGLRRSEQLPDGIEFEIRAMVPTSVISAAEFVRMITHAGKFVGLSPGRSAGFGDFDVLGAE